MEEDDIDYDGMIETFLKGDEGQTLWVRAEDVEVRIGLLQQFAWMVERNGVQETIEALKALEKYIKYGE